MFTTEKEIINPPMKFFIEALRDIGYSLNTAIADIIDNSIAAKANIIDISFSWNGDDSSIRISDDGLGMDKKTLLEALNFTSREIHSIRDPNDLGRFGLGLKIASFSQAREFSVISKQSGIICGYKWDLDALEESSSLFVIPCSQEEIKKQGEFLEGRSSGTVVTWKKLDKIIQSGGGSSSFLDYAESLKRHLSMTFHRFLEDHDFSLAVNGQTIKPWNPIPSNYASTILQPKELIGENKDVSVRAAVLPYKSFLSSDSYTSIGGIQGWIRQEGFYVYRNKRLLVAGGWLGLGHPRPWIQDEQHMLVRIRVDINNTHDFKWGIDVKKSVAVPPADCKPFLESIAEDVRQKGRQAFLSIGSFKKQVSEKTDEDISAWMRGSNGYQINRKHPLITNLRKALAGHEELFDSLMWMLETSVPVEKIWVEHSTDIVENEMEEPSEYDAETVDMGLLLFRGVKQSLNKDSNQTAEYLKTRDPFRRKPKLLSLILSKDLRGETI